MRIPCPHCGWRDSREFTCIGSDAYLFRPEPDAPMTAWDDYLHNRDNPAGPSRDLWYHDACGTWGCVSRDTATHGVHGATGLGEAR